MAYSFRLMSVIALNRFNDVMQGTARHGNLNIVTKETTKRRVLVVLCVPRPENRRSNLAHKLATHCAISSLRWCSFHYCLARRQKHILFWRGTLVALGLSLIDWCLRDQLDLLWGRGLGRKSWMGISTHLPRTNPGLYLRLAHHFQIQCCGQDTSGWITCRFYVSSLRTLPSAGGSHYSYRVARHNSLHRTATESGGTNLQYNGWLTDWYGPDYF